MRPWIYSSSLAFSESSDLYQKLVIQQQKVDTLSGGISAHVDPYAFQILARVKNRADVDTVRDDIYATLAAFKKDLVPDRQTRQSEEADAV